MSETQGKGCWIQDWNINKLNIWVKKNEIILCPKPKVRVGIHKGIKTGVFNHYLRPGLKPRSYWCLEQSCKTQNQYLKPGTKI